MDERVLGEFMGTMVLLLMGNGVVANVLLNKSKGQGGGWIVITAGWAFGVMSGVFTALAIGSGDAHLNPAVTFAAAVNSGDWSRVLPYSLAQLLGAMLGQTLVWLFWLPHFRETPDPDTKLACFATGPAIRNIPFNLISEIIGTFILVLVAAAMSHKRVSLTGPAPALGPLLVGCLVWGLGLSLGGTTGYAINPARDLGPRIAHMILPMPKKADSDWGYAGVPVVGPIIGGALAGFVTRVLF